QCGPDQRGHVVSPVRCEQQCFGARVDIAAVQQQLAQVPPEFGAAGFAGAHHFPFGAEPLRQETQLGGLSCAVTTLEGDEETVHPSTLSTPTDIACGRPTDRELIHREAARRAARGRRPWFPSPRWCLPRCAAEIRCPRHGYGGPPPQPGTRIHCR